MLSRTFWIAAASMLVGVVLGTAIDRVACISHTDTADREHRNSLRACAELTQQYHRHWQIHEAWPKPGTYSTPALKYSSTSAGTIEFERTDIYYTANGFGRMIDFNLNADGTIDVRPFKDE